MSNILDKALEVDARKIELQLFANNPSWAGGTHEERTRYATTILDLIRFKAVTFAAPIFSQDYEGDPKTGTVEVPTRDTEVVISGAYNVLTGLPATQSATNYITITNFKSEACNEIIDGFEAAAVPDGLVAQRLDSAAYQFANSMDSDALGALESEGTTSADTVETDETNAYEKLLTNLRDQRNKNVETDWVICSHNFITKLKLDNRWLGASSDIAVEMRKSGVLAMVDGVAIYATNKLGANSEFVIGDRRFCQRIDEWKIMPYIDDLKGNHIGASALKARKFYKHTVTRAVGVLVKTFA